MRIDVSAIKFKTQIGAECTWGGRAVCARDEHCRAVRCEHASFIMGKNQKDEPKKQRLNGAFTPP